MDYAVYHAATGAIVRAGRSANPRIVEIERERLAEGQALYVGEIDPNTTFLLGGFPAPKPVQPDIITPQEVKAHAGRILSYTDWYVTRQQEGGPEIPEAISAYRQAVREASNDIEAMEPIPADYPDVKYWPVAP